MLGWKGTGNHLGVPNNPCWFARLPLQPFQPFRYLQQQQRCGGRYTHLSCSLHHHLRSTRHATNFQGCFTRSFLSRLVIYLHLDRQNGASSASRILHFQNHPIVLYHSGFSSRIGIINQHMLVLRLFNSP